MFRWMASASGVETVKGRREADREIVDPVSNSILSFLDFFLGDFGELAPTGKWCLLFN